MLGLFSSPAPKNFACKVPFTEMSIYERGEISFCCYSWQPISVGNINSMDILELLASSRAQKIQNTTNKGSFQYCNEKVCPSLVAYNHTGILKNPLCKELPAFSEKRLTLILNYDKSCNLACSSCRNDLIFYNKKTIPQSLLKTHSAVVKNIRSLLDNNYFLTLNMTGSGDPFASIVYRELIQEFQTEEKIDFVFQTNGLLMTSETLTPLLKSKIRWVNVSVDAATSETYSLVRRRGTWETLLKNIHSFDANVANQEFLLMRSWQVNFIVQNENYKELPQFLDWALALKSRPQIWLNLIADWGHLRRKEFQQKAIWKKDHPEHFNFSQVCRTLPKHNDQIQYGNITSFVYGNEDFPTIDDHSVVSADEP